MSYADALPAGSAGLLVRERSIAGPRFSRWLLPTAALAIHDGFPAFPILVGIALYVCLPTLGHLGMAGLFVMGICLILSMDCDGGFSAMPACRAGMFGMRMVGAHNPRNRPVHDRSHMTKDKRVREKGEQELRHKHCTADLAEAAARGNIGGAGMVAWLAIGIPFLIGVFIALQKTAALF